MKARMMLAAISAAALLSGCATVTRGTSQKYYILSEPSEANATLSTGQSCTTPCELKLKRKTEFDVTFTAPGYQSFTTHVESELSGGGGAAAAGNIIAGGIIGGIVDGTNGSLNDLNPNPLKVVLAADGAEGKGQVVAAEKPKKQKEARGK